MFLTTQKLLKVIKIYTKNVPTYLMMFGKMMIANGMSRDVGKSPQKQKTVIK